MPIDFQRPIRSLRSLPSSEFEQDAQGGMPGMQSNDALLLRSLQGQRENEAEERLFNAIRTGDKNEALALKGLIGGLQEKQATSPLGLDIGRKEAGEDFMAEQGFKAQSQGFDSPSAMASYGRGQAEQKMQQPLNIAKMETEAALQKQHLANQGAIELEREQQKVSPFAALLQGGTPPPNVKSMSVPGQGSVTFDSPPSASSSKVPQGAYQQLQKAREAVANSQGFFGRMTGSGDKARAALEQTTASIFNQMNLPSQVRNVANQIANDPTDSQKAFDELANDIDGDPAMMEQLRQALAVLRGRDF